jgi:sugar phosphate isomerase/epimerase
MWSVVETVRAGKMTLPSFVEYAAKQQIDGVELLDYFWKDEKAEIPRVKQQIEDAGLQIGVYSIGNDFFQPDAAVRQQQLDALRHGVDVANALGVGLLRVFSGSHKQGYTIADGFSWIIDGLAAGAEYAELQGVTLVLENHGLIAGRSDQVRTIIQQINSPALLANLDTGNFLLVGQNPVEAAREIAALVGLVHMKDFRYATPEDKVHVFTGLDGRSYTGSITGEGMVDIPAILDILRQAGYQGWLSLEYEGGLDPVTIGVPRSLAAIRRYL